MTTAAPRNWPYPGSGWWKFDFHTHTPFSHDTPWHRLIDTTDELTPKAWLQRYMDAGIDCVAVTDHNGAGWIGKLQAAYAAMKAAGGPTFRELYLFPGVEISISGGFHLLAIFDCSRTENDIVSLLGAVGFPSDLHGQTDGVDDAAVTREAGIKVIEEISRVGGLAIPAHADSDKGLLRLKDGTTTKAAFDANTLRQILNSPHILAMEWVNPEIQKPTIYEDEKIQWTEVLGSDCHNFRAEPLPGSRYTWVKMAAPPSLMGLKLALLDGNGVSVRRSDEDGFDPYLVPEQFITSIEISAARKMGLGGKPAVFELNPGFNSIVGGRGTGKSTVIHFLRIAYQREYELREPLLSKEDPAAKTFARFAQKPDRDSAGGFSDKDETEVAVTVMRDRVPHRLIWQQKSNRVRVEQEINGRWSPSLSQEVTPERFRLRLFSQSQLAGLASERGHALLDIIDQEINASTEKQILEEEKKRFLSLCARQRELDGKLAGRNALLVSLEDVKRKLLRFEQAKHAQVLQEFQRRSRQEREVKRQIDGARAIAQQVRGLAAELHLEDLPDNLLDPLDPVDATAWPHLQAMRASVGELVAALQREADSLSKLVDDSRASLIGSSWAGEAQAAKQRYRTLSDDLKAQGVADPSEYGKLVQERQRLEGEIGKLDSLVKQRETVEKQATDSLQAVIIARRSLSEVRRAFLDSAVADNRFVRVCLKTYGRDAEDFERSLRTALEVNDRRFSKDILEDENEQPKRGIVATLLKGLPKSDEDARAEIERRLENLRKRLVDTCTGIDKKHFGGDFSNYLERECKRRPEFLDRLLTWCPEDSLDVQFSHSGDGRNFRPIAQGSAGQKAAAMLAFLLAHGTDPIVLDQPEDDLDNHLIYELVVQQIRDNKRRRQIIAVTHNANIVVNGDAEMIIAMTATGRECRVSKEGALQDEDVREEVCTVMEGGREAFEKRYRRLGRS